MPKTLMRSFMTRGSPLRNITFMPAHVLRLHYLQYLYIGRGLRHRSLVKLPSVIPDAGNIGDEGRGEADHACAHEEKDDETEADDGLSLYEQGYEGKGNEERGKEDRGRPGAERLQVDACCE